jgi:hypothetical protein
VHGSVSTTLIHAWASRSAGTSKTGAGASGLAGAKSAGATSPVLGLDGTLRLSKSAKYSLELEAMK